MGEAQINREKALELSEKLDGATAGWDESDRALIGATYALGARGILDDNLQEPTTVKWSSAPTVHNATEGAFVSPIRNIMLPGPGPIPDIPIVIDLPGIEIGPIKIDGGTISDVRG